MNLPEPLKKPIRTRDQPTKLEMLQQFMRRQNTKVLGFELKLFFFLMHNNLNMPITL